jgi:hypothetical protein
MARRPEHRVRRERPPGHGIAEEHRGQPAPPRASPIPGPACRPAGSEPPRWQHEGAGHRGAGFLGSHLCAALLDQGDEVVALDNFATSSRRAVDRLTGDPRFTFVEGDVCAEPAVGCGFGAIAHLACPASPEDYLRLPLETLAIGSRGSEFVLRLAEADGCRVLLASTSEVYGDPLERPQREEYWGNVNPIGPRSVYDESKRYAEALFMAHRRAPGYRYRDRPDLQYLWPGPAFLRRAGRVQLHRAGTGRPAADRLRQRAPNPQLLLRHRPCRWAPADAGFRRPWSVEPWQTPTRSPSWSLPR